MLGLSFFVKKNEDKKVIMIVNQIDNQSGEQYNAIKTNVRSGGRYGR